MTNTVSKRITDETISCAVQIESGGRPAIKATTSSATGLGQFLNATWLGCVHKHRPDLIAYGDAMLLTLRTNPSLSIQMLARFWEDNMDIVGAAATPGDLYLAHFLGAGTAQKVCHSIPSKPVEMVVSQAAVAANVSILKGKTCKQVRDWAARRMAASDGHGWVAKWYDPNDPIIANGATEQQDAADDAAEDAAPVKVEEDTAPDVSDLITDATGAAQTDPTPHGQVNDKIANLQKALVSMNYNEVGIVNGAWGGGTRAAIAAFLNDRGMDTVADMSQPVLDEVAKAQLEGFKRPVSQERASMKPKELAQYNPTMKSTLRTKAVAVWGMLVSFAATAFNAVSTYFHSLWDGLAPVRKGLDTVPGFVWVVLAGVACVLLYLNAHKAEKDTADAFQNRRLLR